MELTSEKSEIKIRSLFEDVKKNLEIRNQSRKEDSKNPSKCLDESYLEFESGWQVRRWSHENYKDLKKQLGLCEQVALANYQQSIIGELNFYRRGLFKEHHNYGKVDPCELDRDSYIVSKIINKSEVAENIIVYRGVKPDAIGKVDLQNLEKLKGKLIFENGFMSTTLNKSTGEDFSEGLLLRIKVPKGAKGIFLPKATNSVFNYENEMLFDKNQVLIITEAKIGKRNRLELECQLVA